MTAGIAVKYVCKFGREQLEKNRTSVGRCSIATSGDCTVINIVTKQRFNDKPTIRDFTAAIHDMRYKMLRAKITTVAMPKIGCGLDQLGWKTVREILERVFDDRFTLRVYHLGDTVAKNNKSNQAENFLQQDRQQVLLGKHRWSMTDIRKAPRHVLEARIHHLQNMASGSRLIPSSISSGKSDAVIRRTISAPIIGKLGVVGELKRASSVRSTKSLDLSKLGTAKLHAPPASLERSPLPTKKQQLNLVGDGSPKPSFATVVATTPTPVVATIQQHKCEYTVGAHGRDHSPKGCHAHKCDVCGKMYSHHHRYTNVEHKQHVTQCPHCHGIPSTSAPASPAALPTIKEQVVEDPEPIATEPEVVSNDTEEEAPDLHHRGLPPSKSASLTHTLGLGPVRQSDLPQYAPKMSTKGISRPNQSEVRKVRGATTVVTDEDLTSYLQYQFLHMERDHKTPLAMKRSCDAYLRKFDMTQMSWTEMRVMVTRAITTAMVPDGESIMMRNHFKDGRIIHEMEKQNQFVRNGVVGKVGFSKPYGLPKSS
nr:MAG: hypothetical protein [Tombusviridae sp.]